MFVYRIFICILMYFVIVNISFAKNNYEFDLNYVYHKPYSFTENNIDFKLLKTDTFVMIGGSVIGAGILYLLPESFTNWNKDDSKNIFKKWKDNVSKGPVKDDDDFFLNYVTHPYWGAVYYMSARSSGANVFYSFTYSALLSTFFWEYGVEAFAEIPSKQDLIITPVVGSLFGEMFYRSKRYILSNDYMLFNSVKLGKIVVFLIDPITEISKFIIGDNKNSNNEEFVVYLNPIIQNNSFGYNLNLKYQY